MKHYLYIGFLT